MPSVLIVEDSKMIGATLLKAVEERTSFTPVYATTFQEAVEKATKHNFNFTAAVVDMNLPDAPDGKALEYVLSKNIPAIVFTGGFDEQLCKEIWAKGIVDYVLKNDFDNMNYITTLLNRLEKNKSIKILIADDSTFVREHIENLLKIHQFQVITAVDGQEALNLIKKDRDIKMLITDYNMPNLDGFQLTKQLRKIKPKTILSIIGISNSDEAHLSARFIKHGANDFIYKPFTSEEFYCRVNQNIQMLEQIATIKTNSDCDPLTSLYNHQYFMKNAAKLFENNQNNEVYSALARIDIDSLEKVNASSGHQIGDAAIKFLAEELTKQLTGDLLISRFSGDEFCVFMSKTSPEDVWDMLEETREAFEHNRFSGKNLTISVGISTQSSGSFDTMLSDANEKLKEAKTTGKNRVVL